MSAWPTVSIAGLTFAAITESEAAGHIVRCASRGQGGWLVTPNLDIVRQCTESPQVSAMVRSADLLVADGMPLVWASRLQGTPLPGRVAGSNLVESISGHAAQHGLKVFLLGGDEGIAERAERALRTKYPGLRIVGTYCPPIGFDKDPAQGEHMARLIEGSRPDIVFVGLGFPKQERTIQALRLIAPNAWWLGIGISLSFSAGHVARAPMWMQRTGLEWIHRLIQEPRRLARRYLVEGIPFAFHLLWIAACARTRHPAAH